VAVVEALITEQLLPAVQAAVAQVLLLQEGLLLQVELPILEEAAAAREH
jgi:hypothetical protein